MKGFILFNIIVFASLAVLTALFLAVYFLFLRRRGTKVRPSAVIAVLLGAALLVSTVGNIMHSARYSRFLSYFDSNRVDVSAVGDEGSDSRYSVYEDYFYADSIPGYYRHDLEIENFRIRYYLRDYSEDGIIPGFILYAEYTGDNPDEICWDSAHVKWLDHGEMTGETHVFCEYHSNVFMVLGSIARNVDEIYFHLFCNEADPLRDPEFTIPINIEHVNYN